MEPWKTPIFKKLERNKSLQRRWRKIIQSLRRKVGRVGHGLEDKREHQEGRSYQEYWHNNKTKQTPLLKKKKRILTTLGLSHKMKTAKHSLVWVSRNGCRFLQQCHSNVDRWQFSIVWGLIDYRQPKTFLCDGRWNREAARRQLKREMKLRLRKVMEGWYSLTDLGFEYSYLRLWMLCSFDYCC